MPSCNTLFTSPSILSPLFVSYHLPPLPIFHFPLLESPLQLYPLSTLNRFTTAHLSSFAFHSLLPLIFVTHSLPHVHPTLPIPSLLSSTPHLSATFFQDFSPLRLSPFPSPFEYTPLLSLSRLNSAINIGNYPFLLPPFMMFRSNRTPPISFPPKCLLLRPPPATPVSRPPLSLLLPEQ